MSNRIMAARKNFIFILIIFSLKFSSLAVQNADDDYLTGIKTEGNYQRDRLLNNNLLNPKAWFDPYESSFTASEHQEQLEMKAIKSSDFPSYRRPILDDDDQPIFSNVRGEVINKPFPAYEHTTSDDLPTEGLLRSRGRQQICVLDSIYISRWLKELIFKIENESDREPTTVSFQVDSNILVTLKKLSNAKSIEISTLDSLISSMISQTVVKKKESQDWAVFRGYCSDIAWVTVYVSSLCFIAYVINCFFKWYPKLMLLFFGVVLCVMWHWMNLHQQIKIYKHAELTSANIPDQCKKHDFELFEYIQDYIKSYFISDECDKFYESLPLDPLWEVSFVSSLSEFTVAFLIHPLSTSTKAVNSVIKPIFDDMFVSIIIILVIFVLILLLMDHNNKPCRKRFSRKRPSTFRNYVARFYSNVTSSLRNKICKTSGMNIEDESDTDSDHQERHPSQNRGSSDTAPRSRLAPEHSCSSENCEMCQAAGEFNGDEASEIYSDDSFSDDTDSEEYCPCCIANRELLHELQDGCRHCASKNAARRENMNAVSSRDNAGNLSSDEETDSAEESRAQYVNESSGRRFYGESSHANGLNDPPINFVNPLVA